ncbi:MAG: hypothetical protein AMS27_09415 [Bacteroides sp. SM23_62_1]|nr:MAG: hypothetical protein AMS27_09415 [Bacteroides sp. SM23_62_1]
MVGRLSVGQHSHYQVSVEPGFPAGTYISPMLVVVSVFRAGNLFPHCKCENSGFQHRIVTFYLLQLLPLIQLGLEAEDNLSSNIICISSKGRVEKIYYGSFLIGF